ncbi:hypothetical protein V492_07488 [Pseudogymnoascus sp. VKM F-4246]|nr:hypothetical protein V492_07488 [Pseudogymnoascus sp. VKM F-4246]
MWLCGSDQDIRGLPPAPTVVGVALKAFSKSRCLLDKALAELFVMAPSGVTVRQWRPVASPGGLDAWRTVGKQGSIFDVLASEHLDLGVLTAMPIFADDPIEDGQVKGLAKRTRRLTLDIPW